MKIKAPGLITSRLLPGLQFGDGVLSLNPENFRFFIDLDGFEYESDDYRPGAGAVNINRCFADILWFLCAWVDGDSSDDLFPEALREWAAAHIDDITTLADDLENGGYLFED